MIHVAKKKTVSEKATATDHLTFREMPMSNSSPGHSISPISIQCPSCGNVCEFDQADVDEQMQCQCGEVLVAEPPTSSGDTTAELGIVKSIKKELFSNPFKGFWGYFKRLWAYSQLTLIQIRNPIFSLDQESPLVVQQKGVFFPILFRFLNPFGTTGQEKIQKLDKGYIAYTKESVSLLVFTVLLQLAFIELNDEETTGNLMVALTNGMVLCVYFLSVVIFAVVGKKMTREITDTQLSRKIQEAYVYEATMCFGLVVILMVLQAFGIIGGETAAGGPPVAAVVLWLFTGLHQFYFLVSINRKVHIWTRASIVLWGFAMAFIASMTFLTVLAWSMMSAGTIPAP